MRRRPGRQVRIPKPLRPKLIDAVALETRPEYTAHAFWKKNWEDEWEHAPYLQPLLVKEAILPAHGSAEFSIEYGEIAREGKTEYEVERMRSVLESFVCIMITLSETDPVFPEMTGTSNYVIFTGYIPQEQVAVDGTITEPIPTLLPSGTQHVKAYGLTYLLERRALHDARVDDFGQPRSVVMFPKFNKREGKSREIRGNMSPIKESKSLGSGPVGDYNVFGGGKSPLQWSFLHIVRYLLTRSWNADDHGDDFVKEPAFRLPHIEASEPDPDDVGPPGPPTDDSDIVAMYVYLGLQFDVVEPKDRSVWEMFKSMFPRARGIGWRARVEIDEDTDLPRDGGVVELVPFSTADINYEVTETLFPKNTRIERMTLDDSMSDREVNIIIDGNPIYDDIIVRGERVLVTFSAVTNKRQGIWNDPYERLQWPRMRNPYLNESDEGLELDLPGAGQPLYFNYEFYHWTDAPGGTYWVYEEYPLWPVESLDRGQFLIFEPAWTAQQEQDYLDAFNDSSVQRSEELYDVYHRFQIPLSCDWRQEDGDDPIVRNGTPLDVTFDQYGYPAVEEDTGVLIAAEHTWNQDVFLVNWTPLLRLNQDTGQEVQGEQLDPTAWVQAHDGRYVGKWMQVDSPFEGMPNAQVHPVHETMQFRIKYNPSHLIGKTHYGYYRWTNANPPLQVWADHAGTRFNYDRMVVTMTAQLTTRPTVRLGRGGGSKKKIISVPDAQYWLVAPGTIRGNSKDGKLIAHPGGVIRDDTDRLRKVALNAQAHLSKPRVAINVVRHGLMNSHPVGTIIHAVAADSNFDDIGGYVSLRVWDIAKMTTSIQTSQIELDLIR